MSTLPHGADDANGKPPNVREVVKLYLSRGWVPIPLAERSKRPLPKQWERITREGYDHDVLFPVGRALNVGISLGLPSGGLVDCDLDSPETRAAAAILMPATGLVWGRRSASDSHRGYAVADPPRKASHPWDDPLRKGKGARLLELRSTTGQTVVPPSLLPDDDAGKVEEPCVWRENGEPARVELDDLRRALNRVAAAALVGRYWRPNTRHDSALALAGGLLRAGWSVDETEAFVRAVCAAAGDEEVGDRVRAVKDTENAVRAGGQSTGWPSLAKLLGDGGERIVATVRDWLGARVLFGAAESDDRHREEQRPPTASVNANSGDSRDDVREKRTGWGPPATLPEMPPVPSFPLSIFPPVIADYWQASAESLHVPVDYVAVPALPLLGAAIGRSRAAAVKRTYAEPPLLWCVLVAPPGRAKSPALRAAKGPLPAHTRKWRERHKEKLAECEAENAAYEAELTKWKKNPSGDPPRKPDKPALTQLVIDKFTVESLVRINGDNPRGVVLAQDELAGLVTGLGQYKGGKGDDKQTMLSLWAGAEAEVNRVRDKEGGGMPLYIPNSFAGVAGMIQPDLLALLRGDFGRADFVNDGWADRFLLSFPDPPALVGETWATVSEELERGYASVFDNLLALEMVAETDVSGVVHHRPYCLAFDGHAKGAWQEFTDGIAVQANALDPMDNYIGVLSKLKHYGLRLTALVHCLRVACGQLAGTSDVDGLSVRHAAALVDYFEVHGRRCLGIGWANRSSRIAHRLLAWLARNPKREGFNRTEAFLALKDKKDVNSSEALAPAFRLLVDHNYLRPLDRPENAKPGPVPETYAVNPAWERDAQEHVPKVPTVRPKTEQPSSNYRDSRDSFLGMSATSGRDDMEEFAA